MRSNFTKGLMIGGIIGASIGMMAHGDRMKGRNKRRMVKASRSLLRKSGNIIEDVVDIFR